MPEDLDEAIALLEQSDCTFWACPGPDAEPVDMATCQPHWALWHLRQYRGHLQPA